MSKLKSILLTSVSLVLTAALAVGGTLAYLQDTDEDVNVMTLGNVYIDQHEYERVQNADGTYEMVTSPKYGEGYKLQAFTQDKPLYPATGAITGWGTKVPFDQIEGASGAQAVFAGLNNVQDKFVLVENTGKSDAYVRTVIALEYGANTKDIIGISTGDFWTWNEIGVAEIDNNNYFVYEAIYKGSDTRHQGGILPAGEYTYNSLGQVYLKSEATNEDCAALDGNGNGTYDILVFSQAVQTAGFDNAEAALDAAFGDITADNLPWGDSQIHFPGYVYNQEELIAALETEGAAKFGTSFSVDREIPVPQNAVVDGNGYSLTRAGAMARSADAYTGNIFNVAAGVTLELSNIVVDGGAVWTGEENPYLQRGTENGGVTATGALITANANAKIILGEGAVLQNNDGANAVFLGTRVGATLTLNGGEIINNASAAGAIWGGGAITINSGKVNGNYGGIGGAIRVVTNIGTVLTMNGGEMNHNVSGDVGGAIWAGASNSNNVYVLNGGEMAYNYSPKAGGAIYAGYYETVKISGDFKMHHNSAPAYGAIRFHDHASFVMTGGEIYENGDNSLFLYNNSASITGGKISDSFGYSGGLGLTWGEAEVDGVITYNLSTNHNTAYLAKEFSTLKFKVNEADEHFSNFNFKPAEGYTYTAGDEAKLICMNAGYETYWDAATATFRLQAK